MTQGRHRTESLTSPRRIRAVEKQRQALELRLAGRTLAEIAQVLHYANHQGAEKAIKAALQKTLQPSANEFRAVALERLEKVVQVFWPSMLQQDEKAAGLVLKAIADIRQVLGIDIAAPRETTGINVDNRQIQIIVQSQEQANVVSRLLARERPMLVEPESDEKASPDPRRL